MKRPAPAHAHQHETHQEQLQHDTGHVQPGAQATLLFPQRKNQQPGQQRGQHDRERQPLLPEGHVPASCVNQKISGVLTSAMPHTSKAGNRASHWAGRSTWAGGESPATLPKAMTVTRKTYAADSSVASRMTTSHGQRSGCCTTDSSNSHLARNPPLGGRPIRLPPATANANIATGIVWVAPRRADTRRDRSVSCISPAARNIDTLASPWASTNSHKARWRRGSSHASSNPNAIMA